MQITDFRSCFKKRGVEKLCHSKSQHIKPQLPSVSKKRKRKKLSQRNIPQKQNRQTNKQTNKNNRSGTEKNKTTAVCTEKICLIIEVLKG